MFYVDAGQIIVVGLFIAITISCVAISVRYVRNHVVSQIKRDIIDSAYRIKKDMQTDHEDATSQSNVVSPEDVGDGRRF